MKKLLFSIFFISTIYSANSQSAPEGLFIGSRAPDFKSKDQNGQEIRLKDLLKKGKLVLLFYRGNWSPDDNKELKDFQDSLQLIKDKGASLVAVTNESRESISKTIEKTTAGYPILFDDELKIMKSYDVAFEVPENTITRYRNSGIDLKKINGKEWKYIPVPAVYIIDKEVTVTYRFFNMDYKKRPTVLEILKSL
ncbi:MAG: redoxin domain-containing protein [Bacteroidia bacterium]|nr:redoxin domain-containing protein [Bacteroidia bacterium]